MKLIKIPTKGKSGLIWVTLVFPIILPVVYILMWGMILFNCVSEGIRSFWGELKYQSVDMNSTLLSFLIKLKNKYKEEWKKAFCKPTNIQ